MGALVVCFIHKTYAIFSEKEKEKKKSFPAFMILSIVVVLAT
jgi:hypothetical protein